jgi:UDP-2,4-diacetamido-2,4,6-trideoxy-beta-L-altropyranose hydrolase
MLIRADAQPSIGAGHVMRCLALAQAWQDAGGGVRFAMAMGIETARPLLACEGIEVEAIRADIGTAADAGATAQMARDYAATWVVMDGYRFDEPYQRAMGGAGARTALIDDNGECAPHQADVVVNQNIHAHPDMYRARRSGTELLLGSRYVMLRRAFRQRRRDSQTAPAEARNLLITLGGGDLDNVTLKVLQALPEAAVLDLRAVAVVGAVNPHLDALKATAGASPVAIELRRNEPDMPGLMCAADLAVAAAGSTVWELLYMGVPTISLVIADNQRGIAQRLADSGVLVSLGWHADVGHSDIALAIRRLSRSPQQRQDMAARGRELVDGAGAARIVAAMLSRRDA